MPWIGVTLSALWLLILVVLRSTAQWYRTGSLGWNGVRTHRGPLPTIAGAMAMCGLLATLIAPVATSAAWPGAGIWPLNTAIHWIGTALGLSGIAGAAIAQWQMGPSWRIGVDNRERTALVTRGLYRRVRNPIFTFILISFIGMLATVPSLWTLTGLALTLVGIELQVRYVEEPYLARIHGEAFRAFGAHTGRFVPGIGRLSTD